MPDWLFDQHVRARANRLARRFNVQAGRIGDQDDVGSLVAQKSLEIVGLMTDDDGPQTKRRPVASMAATDRAESDDQRLHDTRAARCAKTISARARSSGVSMSIESAGSVTS